MNNLPIMPQGQANALNPSPQTQLTQEEAALQEYCKYVDNLVKFGLFSEQKGLEIKQNLMKTVSPKPESIVNVDFSTAEQVLNPTNGALRPESAATSPQEGAFELFLKENPNFFENRANLEKYLKSVGVEASKGDLEKIAALVCELESAAVQRFAEDKSHGEALKEFNELAKNKLKTLSQSASNTKAEGSRTFSAEEIGAMSSAEFSANEKAINEMLRRGML